MSQRRVLSVAAALALGLCGQAQAADPRLDALVVPTSAELRLRLDPAARDYTGSVRFELSVKKRASSVRFHSRGPRIRKLTLSRDGAQLAVRQEAGELQVALAPELPLAPGAYVLEIDFENAYSTQSSALYRAERAGQPYLFTQFEADDARGAFPCWDEPSFKHPWQVTLEVPEGLVAVSNTPVEKQSSAAGWQTLVFERTPPLPSYLIAVAVGRFERVPIAGMSVPGDVLAFPGQRDQAAFAAEIAGPLLGALERWFERPYPFRKLDLVPVPDFWPTAMENPGAITFREETLLLDPQAASPSQRARLIRVLAHEQAHQWFGDLVTMAWWDDLWLNESFADWMADKIAGQVHPQYAFDLDQLHDTQRIMRQDARVGTRPIRRPVAEASESIGSVGLAYDKGKAVLSMFEASMGAETLRSGVNAHLRAHAWGNADAADFFGALGRAAGKNVARDLAGFIEQAGLPLVRVETLPGGRLRLTQERFGNQAGAAGTEQWRIPVMLRYSDGAAARTLSVLLDARSKTIQLPVKTLDWVLPNAGGQGYYRWTVPASVHDKLAAAAAGLDVRERIAFLGNSEALLQAGLLPGDRFLGLLRSFAQDTDPSVVRAVLAGLEPTRQAFAHGEGREAFAGYLRAVLTPALDRIGLDPRAGEPQSVALLRPDLLRLLGREGRDPRVLAQAGAWAATFARDPQALDAGLVPVALELAARDGDRALFDSYRKGFEAARSESERRRYLGALGCFGKPELQDEALRYALGADLPPAELFEVPGCMVRSEDGAARAFDWLRQNYDVVVARVPAVVRPFLPHIAAGGCSQQRVDAAREFFGAPEHGGAAALRTVDALAEQVRECVALREREQASVERYLAAAR